MAKINFSRLNLLVVFIVSLALIAGCREQLPQVNTLQQFKSPIANPMSTKIKELGWSIYHSRENTEFKKNYQQSMLSSPEQQEKPFQIKTGGGCIADSGSLLGNGSFEDPAISGGWELVGTMPCWIIEDGNGLDAEAEIDRTPWPSPDGTQSTDLNGNKPVKLSQQVTTIPGRPYRLTFQMAGNPCGSAIKTMEVFWDNQSLGVFTFDITGKSSGNMGWVTHTLDVPASVVSSFTSKITFQSQTFGTSCGPVIDAVKLVEASTTVSTCDNSSGAPGQITTLLNQQFTGQSPDFGSNPANWLEWGGNYQPSATGVTLENPGPGLGVRDNPGEQAHLRTGLYQSGIYKTIPLKHNPGDKLVAKFMASADFSDVDSDTTFILLFNDPNNSYALSSTLRGPDALWQEFYVETEIPDCATEVTVALLGYLGFTETETVTFEYVSVEQFPQAAFQKVELLFDPLDAGVTNSYGANSPANVDEEFGFDFYTIPNWPEKYTNDKAVTTLRYSSTASIGGIAKRINLPAYGPQDRLSALMFASASFTDPDSNTSFMFEFYNSSDQMLKSEASQLVTKNHYRWLVLDRMEIPVGTTYVKIVPLVKLGTNETSGMLWDDLMVYMYKF